MLAMLSLSMLREASMPPGYCRRKARMPSMPPMPSSRVLPRKTTSPRGRTRHSVMARAMESSMARPRVLSLTPGAKRNPSRFATGGTLPTGKTVSKWASTSTRGPSPRLFSTPKAFPSVSSVTPVSPAARSLATKARARVCS